MKLLMSWVATGTLLLVWFGTGVDRPATPPAHELSEAAHRIIEMRESVALLCNTYCLFCPTVDEHKTDSSMGQSYYSPHNEGCTAVGSCADHFCWPEEEDREDMQAFLDALSIASPPVLLEVVAAKPEAFGFDHERSALLVASCPDKYLARIPVSPALGEALSALTE